MIMIKEALQYIVGLGKAEEHVINGACYSDKPLHRIDTYYPKADAIEMHTLTSLVDYIKSEVDEMPPRMIVEVKSPTEVELYSQLDPNRDRESLVVASARVPGFEFDRFVEHEKFCINLQSKFIPSDDRELILKFAGTVEAGSVSEYGDDGVTQKATIKTGLASKGDAIVPNPVCLRPYRTFLEVEQPESAFVFRMKQDSYGSVMCAIFEADGGAWKMDATQAIKEYLQRELDGMPQFTVIS
jgi:hypothetical protein|uniref:Uncharacterized protein n=1 Tax=Siphoviridae sp. ct39g3 TaxID=2825320 RepID=A0A8S5P6P9_9CAUD|nr:MAG TPA: hypothetical protein [Siphoviridae sp. ct39g3]DAL64768.1 MAG TPA_asm: hypothetical protein [Caudoviricetes sp.]DAW86902.1 MAG TPA: hypothetical protein [Bacteriophage sp.]